MPVLGSAGRDGAVGLLMTLASCDAEDGEAEIGTWLAGRSGPRAARELIRAAASGSPGLRGAAFAVLDRIGGAATPEIRAALADPLLRAHAAVWLHEHDEEAELRPEDRTWLLVDLGAGLLEEADPLDVVAELLPEVPAPAQADIVAGLWRVDHPGVIGLLTALSEHHPDPGVARAARKAAFKARSPGGSAPPGFIDLEQRRRRACVPRTRRNRVSIRPIRLFGDPVLRTPAEPVTDFDAELRRLVKDLSDTMLEAPGVGLAAPQIGVGLRVFTYYIDDELGHLINPDAAAVGRGGDRRRGLPVLPRPPVPDQALLRRGGPGFNMYGEPVTLEGTGQMARCVQHETDHLDGVLFIDRLDAAQRKLAMKEIRAAEWWGEPVPVVRDSPHPTRGKAI